MKRTKDKEIIEHHELDHIFINTILNCIADGVFTIDKNWKIMTINPAAEKILGISADKAIGKNCSSIFRS